MPTENYYTLLGITPAATQAEIKKAYRQLAKKYHPDVSKEADAESRFKKIVEAYDVLKNKNKREQYDRLGRYSNQAASSTHFQGVDLSIFADLFNQGMEGKKETPAKTSKPIDQTLVLPISLEEMAQGANKQIRLKHKTVAIEIPIGIEENQIIRLRQQASNGGDLLVKIKAKLHKQFKHKGKNLFTKITVSLDNNKLPKTLHIPTLSKIIPIKTPKKLKSSLKAEHQLCLKGLGLPSKAPKPAGDLFVTVNFVNTFSSPEVPKSTEALLQEVKILGQNLQHELTIQHKAKHHNLEYLLQELSCKTDKLITEANNPDKNKVIVELRQKLKKLKKFLG